MNNIIILLYFPLALTAPSNMFAQATSSDSIKVAWTPAPTASSVSVTYYINASSSTYQTVRRTVTDPDHVVIISGLHPFAEYYITVQAGNPGGLSAPTGRHETTLTAGIHLQLLLLSCRKLPLLAIHTIDRNLKILSVHCSRGKGMAISTATFPIFL